MSFNQQPQSKQHPNHADQASPPSAYVVAQRERTYQRWLRPLLGEPPWPISEIDQDFPNRRLWPPDWAGLAHRLRPCHSWAEVVAQLKAWLLAQPERLLRLLAALPPGQALRRLSLSQLVALALSAGLTAGMVGQPLVALAQGPAPVGDEFRVNTFTATRQRIPSVAIDQDGDFVITWTSSVQDGNFDGVYAQRYAANGAPQGNEFRVNTFITSNQTEPGIAMDKNGNFIVVWESWGDQDGSSRGIFAQRYNASGGPQGDEFPVNTYTTGIQSKPSVAMDADGNFTIAWSSLGQDGDSYGIFAQRYNASGVPQGDEFPVNTYTTLLQSNSKVAMDADGNFVITWDSLGQDAPVFSGIFAQRYNANGIPQGGEFQVNTFVNDHQRNPAIGMDKDGDFIIAWNSAAQDGGFDGVYAQLYNADGTPRGSEFRVNTYTTNSQNNPSVGMDSDGDFAIAWQSFQQDGSGSGVYAQQYRADGTSDGGEFQVNTYTTSNQQFSSVAMDANGNFVITWQDGDFSAVGQDGAGYGVYAQRYSNVDLSLVKSTPNQTVRPDDIITYTIRINNSGIATATNTIVSDTLPIALNFIGPVRLDPPGTTLPVPTLPTLATGLTITPGEAITLTFPVSVSLGVDNGTPIINVASVTSDELSGTTPITGSSTVQIVNETNLYLPLILK